MEFFNKIKEWWRSLEKRTKIIYSSIVISAFILLIIVFLIILNPAYSTLVTGLDNNSAGAVISKLEEMNIKYKTYAGGTIKIANADVYEVNMKLATAGVIGYGSIEGYSLLKDQGMGATSYDKQVNYQIALEGELSKTVSTISGVKYARVHLVIPPRTYYTTGEDSKAKASVLLVLDSGKTISTDQVRGIVNIVSGSVQGLLPADVNVVDNMSRNLSSGITDNEDMTSANNKFELKKTIESYYTKKIQDNLQSVFGYGNVVVISEVDMNWTKIEQEEREVKPVTKTGGILLSQQTESSETSSTGSSGSSVGTDSNIPPYTYQSQDSSPSSSSKTSKTISNYDVGEIYNKVIEDKNGEISSKNFTVFIDFKNAGQPENTETVSQIENALSIAISSPQENIKVLSMQFNRDVENYQAKIEEDLANKQRMILIIIVLIFAVLIITFFLFILMKFMKRRKLYTFVEERKKKLEDRVKEVVGQKEPDVEEFNPQKEIQKKLEDIVDTRISDVVEIIKIWMNSD